MELIFLNQEGSSYSTLILMALIFMVVYLFMIRPGIRKQKAERNFQNTIKRGLKVVTISGIHGKIKDVGQTTVDVETGAGVIKMEKTSISREWTNFYNKKVDSKKK